MMKGVSSMSCTATHSEVFGRVDWTAMHTAGETVSAQAENYRGQMGWGEEGRGGEGRGGQGRAGEGRGGDGVRVGETVEGREVSEERGERGRKGGREGQ